MRLRFSKSLKQPTVQTPSEPPKPPKPSALWVLPGKIGGGIFWFCYLIGARTLRMGHRFARLVRRAGRPVCAFIGKRWNALRSRLKKRWKQERRLFEEDRLFLKPYMEGVWKEKSTLASLGKILKVPLFFLYRHRKTVGQCLTVILPVVSALLLYGTVRYWSRVSFGLAVEYQGKDLGYITDEAIFKAGADMASDRIISTDAHTFQVERTPRLTLAVVQEDDFLSETQVCDKILQTSGDEIAQMSGLYVDGEFEGALESRVGLDNLLQSILDQYTADEGMTTTVANHSEAKVLEQKAEFIQKVEVIDGLYPVSAVLSANAMRTKLTADSVVNRYYTVVAGDTLSQIARINNMTLTELYAMNSGISDTIIVGDQIRVQRAQPFLRVQVVQKIRYTESVPYKTVEQTSSSYYVGDRHVRVTGRAGSQTVTAEVTLVDGVAESIETLNTVVTRNPVDEVVVVGSKTHSSSHSSSSSSHHTYPSGPTTGSGNFMWPVPSSHLIYSGYGYRHGHFHKGIDIAGHNIYGKSVLAADGGRVIQTNHSDGPGYDSYGNYVLIDHGNGFMTMYAHMSAVYVSTGSRVSKGQTIGAVGSTGRSTGPHLHFEIRYHGSSISPTHYVR